MITGDHAVTAAAIAGQLGIDGRAITGAEFAAMSDDELAREIDDIGVIARVTPEHKVRLVEILQAQGPHRRDDRRRRQRRARAEEGRHRHRDGHHRHGGLQGGRRDDPDRRQLRHHRQGRRDRPRPVRQPEALRPLPDGRACSASSPRSSAPASSTSPAASRSCRCRRSGSTSPPSCSRPSASAPASRTPAHAPPAPRAPTQPILPSRALAWLAFVGLVMGAVTLTVIAWATPVYGMDVARTMGLTTFSHPQHCSAFTTADDDRSIFTLETFDDHRFLVAGGMSCDRDHPRHRARSAAARCWTPSASTSTSGSCASARRRARRGHRAAQAPRAQTVEPPKPATAYDRRHPAADGGPT